MNPKGKNKYTLAPIDQRAMPKGMIMPPPFPQMASMQASQSN